MFPACLGANLLFCVLSEFYVLNVVLMTLMFWLEVWCLGWYETEFLVVFDVGLIFLAEFWVECLQVLCFLPVRDWFADLGVSGCLYFGWFGVFC